MPAQAGIQNYNLMDSRFRGNDRSKESLFGMILGPGIQDSEKSNLSISSSNPVCKSR